MAVKWILVLSLFGGTSADSTSASTTTTLPCQTCTPRPTPGPGKEGFIAEKLLIEQVKILHKIHLDKRPNISLTHSQIPELLLRRKFGALQPGSAENSTAQRESINSTESFIIGKKHEQGSHCAASETSICFKFKVEPEVVSGEVEEVVMYFSIRSSRRHSGNRTFVLSEARTGVHIASVLASLAHQWIELLLTAPIRLLTTPQLRKEKLKLLKLSCMDCGGAGSGELFGWRSPHQPTLYIKTSQSEGGGEGGRRKREVDECSPNIYNYCCLRSLYVNFTHIGWSDWVIQPPGYYANYCTGNCRLRSSKPYGKMMGELCDTKKQEGKECDEDVIPCCSPKTSRPLSLLYAVKPGEILKKDLGGMIVESCGC